MFSEAFCSYEDCQFKTITKKTKTLPVSSKGYMAFTKIGWFGYFKYRRVGKKRAKNPNSTNFKRNFLTKTYLHSTEVLQVLLHAAIHSFEKQSHHPGLTVPLIKERSC